QPLQALDADTAGKLGIAGGPGEVRTVEVRFQRSGMASVLDQMEEELVPTQLESILLTLAVVVVVLGLVFRTVFGGFLALAPLALTILVNFAVMGYAGVGLDAFTAMVASISIGLGIDYAIHFTHRFKREWTRAAPDLEKALRETFATSGVAIMINAASVGLGFLVLLAAGGQHIRRFGGLSALTMLVAGALTLTLLPALFVRLRPRFVVPGARRPEGRGRLAKEDTMRPLTEGIMKGTAGLAILLALTPSTARAQDGRAILARVDSVMNAPADVSAVERMTLIDEDGSEKERSMRFRQKGPEMRIMHFLEPADVRDVGFLRLAEDRMYLYLPAFRRVRRIASSIQNEDFMGTDFSYEDMSLTSYGEDYRVTGVEGGEGAGAWRLTLEPRQGADVSYARLVLDVDPADWI
ncbi:MAG TPA: outer membrane lipoprotein-sorting protein, partial [Longimicrobiales bacterium]|nr:outer membrane lipoprotein-sorting protein [Longimicrobiales bacterium]